MRFIYILFFASKQHNLILKEREKNTHTYCTVKNIYHKHRMTSLNDTFTSIQPMDTVESIHRHNLFKIDKA